MKLTPLADAVEYAPQALQPGRAQMTSQTTALAETIVAAAAVYLAAGLIFALVFAFLLVGRVSPGARASAPLQFRLVILPGLALLWPVAAIAAAARWRLKPAGSDSGDPA